MKITVKTVSKEEYAIELPASETVGDLKNAACEKMLTVSGCLTLVHLGTVLNDDCKTLAEHNIAEGAGALAYAALKKQRDQWQGKRVACVLTGGNASIAMIARALA